MSPINEAENFRRLLLEMIYPRRAQKLAAASPPPIMFYWPNMISMRVRVMRLSFQHKLFQVGSAAPRLYLARVELEEEAMDRIYSEDMARSGTFRPWSAAPLPRRI